MAIYIIYKILSIVFSPIIFLMIKIRIKKQKEDSTRYKEKFGIPTIARPNGKLIWIHAASVGELNAVVPIIKKLPSSCNVLITTVTITSASLVQKLKLKNCVHQFLPVDVPWVTKRFIEHWRPNLVIFAESEIWPNLIVSAKRSASLLLLNASISDKSFKRWKMVKPLARFIFAQFSEITSRNQQINEKILEIYPDAKITITGNIKYIADKLQYSKSEVAKLASSIKNRNVVMFASTHKEEEQKIIHTSLQLIKKHKNIFIILMPRHPSRSDNLQNLCVGKKLSFAIRSQGEQIRARTRVYIADTIGEAGIFYKLSQVVFVGGSLFKKGGGHNILEPARLKCAIVTGMYYENFREVVSEFIKGDAILIAENQDQLYHSITHMLSSKADIYAQNALKLTSRKDIMQKEIMSMIDRNIT